MKRVYSSSNSKIAHKMIFKSVIVLISFVSVGHALKCFECLGGKKCVNPEQNIKPKDCTTVEYDGFGFPIIFKLPWYLLLTPELISNTKLRKSEPYEYNCVHAGLSNNVAIRSCWRGKPQDFQTMKEIIMASEYSMFSELCATDGCNQKIHEASKCGGSEDSNNAATSITTLGVMSLIIPLVNFLVR